MAIYFESNKGAKLPGNRHEAQEFGRGKKSIIMCSKCRIVYFNKSWHRHLEDFKQLEKNPDFELNFRLCPACQMIKNHQYEGIVRIKNIPEEFKNELGELVVAYCRRAYEVDPLDRLIEVNKHDNDWEVTVTENQLANKLARKIKETFNNVKTKTVFLGEPSDVADVVVKFEKT